MERPVIFLQSLLVLVVAIQVISACKCVKQRTMEESICLNETLVMATPVQKYLADKNENTVYDLHLAYYVVYKTYMNTMYHEGPTIMNDDHPYFELVTPRKTRDCGVPFKTDISYYIAGTVREDGSLFVTSCDYAAPVTWHLSHDEQELLHGLLTSHSQVDCSALA